MWAKEARGGFRCAVSKLPVTGRQWLRQQNSYKLQASLELNNLFIKKKKKQTKRQMLLNAHYQTSTHSA